MKKLLKSKRFLGSVMTVILVGLGVANPELVAPVATELACKVAACES